MNPINKKERDSLFWQFVVMFSAALALFLMVLHFDFKVPVRITEIQRKKLAEYEMFSSRQTRIAAAIEKMEDMIVAMAEGRDVTGQEGKVNEELSLFKKEFAGSGTDTANGTYRLIMSMYNAMDKHRASQRSAVTANELYRKCKDDLDPIKDENARLKNDLRAHQNLPH